MLAGCSIGTDRAPSTTGTEAEEAEEAVPQPPATAEGRDAIAASATIAGYRATWIHWLKAFR